MTSAHIPGSLREQIAAEGGHRCGYCLTSQDHTAMLIIGLTTCGRATVAALRLNNDYLVKARRRWVMAGWHPPQE